MQRNTQLLTLVLILCTTLDCSYKIDQVIAMAPDLAGALSKSTAVARKKRIERHEAQIAALLKASHVPQNH